MPSTCFICNRGISRLSTSLSCSICFSCCHQSCLGISFETFNIYNKPSSNWICPDHSVGMPDSECTVKKSLRVLESVKRHSSEFKNLDSLKLLYCAIVRSILEYGSPIWSPYNKSNIEIIEGVQNRFSSFAAYKSNTVINQYDYQ